MRMGPSETSCSSVARSCGVVQTVASGMCSPTSITPSAYVLCRRRDLADDLDDVAVRVEHAQLGVGARAATEDVLDTAELAVGAELARVRLRELERSPDHLRDRHAV